MQQNTQPDLTDEDVSTLLRGTRKKLGATKGNMSEWLNVPYNTYTAWERGEIRIRHKTIMRLALITLTLMHGDKNEESTRNNRTSDKPRGSQTASELQDTDTEQ